RSLYDNDRKKSLTGLPLLHLGLALNMQGDQARGKKAIADAFAKKSERPGYLGDYGTALRDETLMVMLAKKHKLGLASADSRLLALSKDIAARSAQRYVWYSTQERIALARLGKTLANSMDREQVFEGQQVIGSQASELTPDRLL